MASSCSVPARHWLSCSGQLRVAAWARPVLVAYEDAHWMDPSTLDLLGRILDAITAWPVLLLVTSRPDNEPKLAAHPNVTRLTLNRLGRSGAERMVAQLAGQNLPGDMIELIVNRTDGVPLFVEEVTMALARPGTNADGARRQRRSWHRRRLLDQRRSRRLLLASAASSTFPCFPPSPTIETFSSCRHWSDWSSAGLVCRRGIDWDALYTFKDELVQDAAYERFLRRDEPGAHQRLHNRWPPSFRSAPIVSPNCWPTTTPKPSYPSRRQRSG